MPNPIKKSQTTVYRNYRVVLQKVFELPNLTDNQEKKEITMEVFETSNTVIVCALDLSGNLILNRQFRFGPEQFLLEFPGGGCDQLSEIKNMAKRELLEETGYEGDLEFLETVPDGPYYTGQTHIFVARNCQLISEPTPEIEEIITNILIKPTEFKSLITNPDFVHANWLAKLIYLKVI